MKKFKFLALILSLGLALSLLAGCHFSSFKLEDGKIHYGISSEVVDECYVRTDKESPVSSYFAIPKSADKFSAVFELFEGITFSETTENVDEDMHYDTFGLICKSIKVKILIFENGICIAETEYGGKTAFYKADVDIEHENAHSVIAAHLYVK